MSPAASWPIPCPVTFSSRNVENGAGPAAAAASIAMAKNATRRGAIRRDGMRKHRAERFIAIVDDLTSGSCQQPAGFRMTPLPSNTRKTECGARRLLVRLVVRTAPFALLCRTPSPQLQGLSAAFMCYSHTDQQSDSTVGLLFGIEERA